MWPFIAIGVLNMSTFLLNTAAAARFESPLNAFVALLCGCAAAWMFFIAGGLA